MAADDYNPVSLRHKSRKKTRGGNGTMSRRRISVKELGHPDHQGWLYRKKESKGFLGMKWKKYWFVLKKTGLYWYATQQAEKAEGYIDLANFVIDIAIECKKKHAFKACHPQVMMFYFAAESYEDMTTWLNKLGLASIHYEPTERNTAAGECYSEASDHEETESSEAPPPPYSEDTLRDSQEVTSPPGSTHQVAPCVAVPQGTLPPPYSPAPAVEGNGSLPSTVSTMTSQSSSSSLAKLRQSWMDLVSQASPPTGEAPSVCSVQVLLHQTPPELAEDDNSQSLLAGRVATQDSLDSALSEESPAVEEEETQRDTSSSEIEGKEDKDSDEMEKLYIHLKEASLSPTGQRKPSTKREFRASFIKRCKNQTINDRLHLIRTLNSTLKSKEGDLQTIEQVLSEPQLTSTKFRQWKESNASLVHEICLKGSHQGEPEADVAADPAVAAPVAALAVETSL